MIFTMFMISLFSATWRCVTSRTLSSFPRSGKTPYLSRPTTARPATASALALSPSVRMRVQCCAFLPPASFASSSLGMPSRRLPLPPLLAVLSIVINIFVWASAITAVTTSVFSMTSSMKALVMLQVLPKLDALRVICSFVCELKAGFSTRQLTKTQSWFFTWMGLISEPLPASFFALAWMASTSWSTTCATCVPPFGVLMALTKELCWNPSPSDLATRISQRLLTIWWTKPSPEWKSAQ
mmetsp:Transcript_13085/g.34606  ORF Transcript_13085/g.34606 Transcript_13085/m.34606 type:complete len:240 (-) Transcript_13085:822-1541(-)